MSKIYKIELSIAVIFVGAVLFSFFYASRTSAQDSFLHVYFLDVGQGDAMLIRAPDGNQVLIDGGPGSAVVEQLAKIMAFSDHDLDAIVATHTDADHLSGFVSILDRYHVSHIIETGMHCETDICAKWETAAAAEGADRTFVHEGYQIQITPEVILTVLNPPADVHGQKVSKTNNAGIVLRLDYGKQSVLFTADIEKTVEQRLLAESANLDVDFLKVGHHGSKTSSSPAFLDAVSPIAAFIEVGARNTYGHPSPETLDQLARDYIPWYRTDQQGTIELVLDGTNYKINAHGNPSH